jgi:tetratricopeptide (TPR) repeat protein
MAFFSKLYTAFFFVLLLCQVKLNAQIEISAPAATPKQNNSADKLALQYFEQKEFEKANVYFEDLYNKAPDSWYSVYFKSLLGAKDFSTAEKITKRQLKQNKNNVYLYVYLARIYRLQNDTKKEKDLLEKSIKELLAIHPYLQNLTAVFLEDNLYDYAIQAYNKGRKTSSEYPYFYERADVYKLKNDLVAMINEYLDALEFSESEFQTVKMNLQNSLGYDDDEGGIKNPLLKQELQKRIQKNPDKIILIEFLIFIQNQQKDFEGAFVQSRSLDKRLKEEGQRINDLARICVSNKKWDVAKRCYDYIIEKGPNNPFYDIAVIDGLNAEYLALTDKPQPKQEELLTLEQKLAKACNDYKQNFYNAPLVKNLAVLKAYYLNKSEEAITLLDDFISQPGLDIATKANFKTLLGDIYLIHGEIWEASLLYSQVEKDFKYEAIGQEAKFKNAKLSFYAGDFAWSKTQADVLKGATTKLISNDALDLSLIITDAIGVDTNDVPLKLFSSAELMILQHKYNQAIARMDSINLLFNNNTLVDDIYFKKAQIYFTLGKFTDAELMYKNIIEYYPTELYGDDAQFKLAELYENNLNDKEKAKKAYEDVLINYPGSVFTGEARKRFRELRGDKLNN